MAGSNGTGAVSKRGVSLVVGGRGKRRHGLSQNGRVFALPAAHPASVSYRCVARVRSRSACYWLATQRLHHTHPLPPTVFCKCGCAGSLPELPSPAVTDALLCHFASPKRAMQTRRTYKIAASFNSIDAMTASRKVIFRLGSQALAQCYPGKSHSSRACQDAHARLSSV